MRRVESEARPRTRLLAWVAWNLAASLVLLEIGLRAQQALGPLYDLDMADVDVGELSDELNHTHPVGRTPREVPGLGRIFVEHDALGLRVEAPPFTRPTLPRRKVLFLGDSFMDGYDDAHTIPVHVRKYAEAHGAPAGSLAMLNAGCTSYAPSIFIPQVKRLVPRVRPDLVVVDIDETDLGDDYIRYRSLLVRDARGRIAGVRATPLHATFLRTLADIREEPSYLVRFVRKTHHTRVRMPREEQRYRAATDPRHVLLFASDGAPDARRRYARELRHFESTMDELTVTLKEALGDPARALLVHHPHLQHLQASSDGRTWNTFVAEIVGRVAARHGIPFYDATEDLRRRFGSRPAAFYVPGDMHFNFAGLEAYATLVAERVVTRLSP
jgi:lysophospholipase L1-like esterase